MSKACGVGFPGVLSPLHGPGVTVAPLEPRAALTA